MKRIALLIIASLLSLSATAQDKNPWLGKKIPAFQLADGTIFKDATITRIDPDAIVLTHATGVRRVPMEELREESKTALGYDPAKAAAAREQYRAKIAVINESNLAEFRARQAIEQAQRDYERAAELNGEILQVLEDGFLLRKLRQKTGGIYDDEIHFLYCPDAPEQTHLVDGTRLAFRGLIQGTYRYEAVNGGVKTVTRWVEARKP